MTAAEREAFEVACELEQQYPIGTRVRVTHAGWGGECGEVREYYRPQPTAPPWGRETHCVEFGAQRMFYFVFADLELVEPPEERS